MFQFNLITEFFSFVGDVANASESHDFFSHSSFTAVASTPASLTEALKRPPLEEHLLQHTLWPEVDKLYGHANEIMTVACSHDGKIVASACKAAQGDLASIRLWNTSTWKSIGLPLEGHSLTVTDLKFSHNDQYLLSVSRDRHWILWSRTSIEDAPFKLLCQKEKAHGRIIWRVSWSHDDLYFATASRDKTVRNFCDSFFLLYLFAIPFFLLCFEDFKIDLDTDSSHFFNFYLFTFLFLYFFIYLFILSFFHFFSFPLIFLNV